MPTLVIGGYKFRFYSSDKIELPHVHVLRGENVAKVWLSPVSVQYSYGYNEHERNRITELTQQNCDRLLEVWHDYFGT